MLKPTLHALFSKRNVTFCSCIPYDEECTLYKKSPDPGLCLELCQHCACLFHVHVFVQVRGIPAGHTMSMLRSWT